MDASAVQRVLDRYYAVLNAHDLDGIAGVVTDDVVFDDDFAPGTVFHGATEFRNVFEGMWLAFPDWKLDILRGPFLAEGTAQGAVHGRITGTLATPVPDWGFTRVGGKLELEFIAVYEVDGDRVSYIRVCLNPAIAAHQMATT
jgi:hypothetical protein